MEEESYMKLEIEIVQEIITAISLHAQLSLCFGLDTEPKSFSILERHQLVSNFSILYIWKNNIHL